MEDFDDLDMFFELDKEFIICTEALDTVDKIQELVSVINRRGLEDSIRELFGKDLTQLSPAYAAGLCDTAIVAELNAAVEGLGQTILDGLQRLWEMIKRFVTEMIERLGNAATRIRKAIKAYHGIAFEKGVYLNKISESEVPLHKRDIDKFRVLTASTRDLLRTTVVKMCNEGAEAGIKSQSDLFKIIGVTATVDEPSHALVLSEIPSASAPKKMMRMPEAGFRDPMMDLDWLVRCENWLHDREEERVQGSKFIAMATSALNKRVANHLGIKDVNNPTTEERNRAETLAQEARRILTVVKMFLSGYFNYIRMCVATMSHVVAALNVSKTVEWDRLLHKSTSRYAV